MSTLSLARIMYGTNEDFHAASTMRSGSPSSLAAPEAASRVHGVASALSRMFHEAWQNLIHKG